MKKSKKMIAAAIAVFVMTAAFMMTSCKKAAEKQSIEQIKEAGVITVYTNAEFPPFEYMSDNTPVGVDMQIAQAIADEIGVRLEIKNVKFDTILSSVNSGKGSMGIAGISVTDERKQEVDFSVDYATSKQYVIVPKDSEIAKIEDLAGKKIGVQLGTTGDIIISGEISGSEDEETKEHIKGALEGTNASVTQYNSAADAAVAMNSGKVDVVVIDKLPAEIVAKQYENFKAIELVYADGSNTEESYAVCVAKGNKELLEVVNKVIEKLINDGSIDQWIIDHTTKATAS